MTSLRDEDILTTTNTVPGGDADQSDSAADPSDSADPAGADPGSGGDADQSDAGDADSSDS